jgi:hypothetical protein
MRLRSLVFQTLPGDDKTDESQPPLLQPRKMFVSARENRDQLDSNHNTQLNTHASSNGNGLPTNDTVS